MKTCPIEVRAVLDIHGALEEAQDCEGVTSVGVNPALLSLSQSRSVLLLQGPVGPFFDRLTAWLRGFGATVNRVVFHGGDEQDCQALSPIKFIQPLNEWSDFFQHLLQSLSVDHVVLFGQSRHYHTVARRVCESAGVPVVVMEEGYFRPGYATMELGGVNGYSRTLSRYRWSDGHPIEAGCFMGRLPAALKGSIQPDDTASHFQKMAWHASSHYSAIHLGRHRFPHYQHHKADNPYWYARYWVWSWFKKLWFRWADRSRQAALIGGSRPYFLVPLQHDGDAQITHHSCFGQNTDFIIRVLRSFCEHAFSDSQLVFRQHPHSRGGVGHAPFIRMLARELGISERVFHLVEGDTPLLAENSAGVVLINSTVGLQALERRAPLMVLGDALYKQPGLSFSGDLDDFWKHGHRPDPVPTRDFLAQIKNLTQVPVSLYALRGEPLVWDNRSPFSSQLP